MTIQELKDFCVQSDFSEETKSIISDVLVDKTEITPGLVFQIKDILQKEIDADFEEVWAEGKNDPEMQKIEKEYVETLDVIEKDLNEDLNFVDKELKELDEIRKKINQASDEMKADKLRQTM